MRSFYNEYQALNDSGKQANGEAYRFIDDFFKRWIAMGHDTRELQNIIVDETVAVSARERLIHAMRLRKDLDKRKTFVAKNKAEEQHINFLNTNEFAHLENKETGEITFVKGD